MLRIILWKIGFEWAHLLRFISPCPDRKVYYFAFGANLSQAVLRRRRIRVYEEYDYALSGATLRFSLKGFYRHHGYASADPVEGEVVYGKMYLILQRDANRMDYFEGVPVLRTHEKVQRVDRDLRFFHYRAPEAESGLMPTQEYLNYLVSAYREMPEVPVSYVDRLANTKVLEEFLPQNKTGEFVRDITRWPVWLRPLLVYYERCCLRLVEFLWNRSLVQWMIKV